MHVTIYCTFRKYVTAIFYAILYIYTAIFYTIALQNYKNFLLQQCKRRRKMQFEGDFFICAKVKVFFFCVTRKGLELPPIPCCHTELP